MPREKTITHQMFQRVKQLAEQSYTKKSIANIVGISQTTTRGIIKAETYESFYENMKIEKERSRNRLAYGVALKEEDFTQIKKALARGASGKDIAKVFNVCETTVSLINTSASMEEYKQRMDLKKKHFEKAEKEPAKGIDLQTFWYNMNRMYEEMKKQTELLEKIAQQWE